MNKVFYYFKSRWQSSWNYSLWALLIFPLSPLLGAVTIGFVSLITWLKQFRKISRRPLNWGFALLSVLLIISAGFAQDKTAAFLGLFNLLPFFLVFAAHSTLIQTFTQLRQMAWIVVIGSIPVIIIGLGQLFLGWSLKFQFMWVVLSWTIAPGGNPPGRIASLFLHANTFAAYLVIVFILGLGLWLENYQQLRVKGRQSFPPPLHSTDAINRVSRLPLLFLTVAVITNFIALIFTNSRNGWAIAMGVCLAYALYQGWHILVGGVAAIVSSVLLAAFAPSPVAQIFRRLVPAFFWARLNDDMYPDRPVALMRKTQWEFAWFLAQEHPWTGWGLRSFSGLYKAQMQIPLGHPHNLFLMLSAETGFPSTFLFCGLLVWILITGVQLLRKSKYIKNSTHNSIEFLGMGNGAWGMGKKLPMPDACRPKRRGDYPETPTIRLSFPSLSINTEDRLIFFSYLLAFVGWLLLNTIDVTLFDFRLNALSWLILAAICGVVHRYNSIHLD